MKVNHLMISIAYAIVSLLLPMNNLYGSNTDEPVRYLDPVFENIEIQTDIIYGSSANSEGVREDLLLDLYTPAGDYLKNRPAIIWIHGGGFRLQQDKTQKYIVDMASRFARRGYVCLSINYRVRENPMEDPAGTMHDALEDAMTALDWLRENSERLGVDKSRIIVGGGSAGGMVAVNFCYRNDEAHGKWDKSGIIGLVDLWGSPRAEYSFYEIDAGEPPAIIVHGTEDASVAYSNSTELVKNLESKGIKNELVTIEGAGHTPASHMDDFSVNIARFLFELIQNNK